MHIHITKNKRNKFACNTKMTQINFNFVLKAK